MTKTKKKPSAKCGHKNKTVITKKSNDYMGIGFILFSQCNKCKEVIKEQRYNP